MSMPAVTAHSSTAASKHGIESSLEALKWLALVSMTVDHVNKYLLGATEPWMFAVGRLAFPLFAAVVGLHLADAPLSSLRRMLARMVVAGIAAQALLPSLGGVLWGWWPLNVMWTFGACCSGAIFLRSTPASKTRIWLLVAASLVAGAVVEFWWPALLFVAGVAWWRATGRRLPIALAALGLVGLCVISWGAWAAASVPLIAVAMQGRLPFKVPRSGVFFYAYYVGHLAALLVVKSLLA